jgi:hypothetical protein
LGRVRASGCGPRVSVILPEELRVQHWFEVRAVAGGTLVRHTVDGEAFGRYRRSGATGSVPATTASSKPFSTTSRRPWPENSDRREGTRSLTRNGVGIRRLLDGLIHEYEYLAAA